MIDQYANERIAIGVAILLAYFFHYMIFGSVHLMRNGKPNELKEVEKNIFLFGIAGILSCNIFQSGIYQAVLCYFTLICLLILHLPVFYSNLFNWKKYFWLAFYFMLFMWYFGIIVDYYDFYSALQ